MRVLVTGAAGFFGSRISAHFEGDEVHAIDVPAAPRARLEALAPGAKVHAVDLLDAQAVRRLVDDVRPELAIHLAWYAVPGRYLHAEENLDHVEATIHLARALAGAGCARLVTAGTCFEYHTAQGLLAETSRTLPRSLYAACKLSVAQILGAATERWGISFAHLRFFYQYGPWEAPQRLVPAVIEPLLRGEEARVTSGDQVRDFLHIDDVARAVVLAARSEKQGVINVGSGVPVRVRDVVKAAARACGRPELVRYGALPGRPDDPPFVCADTSVLRGLGFQPRFDLDAGLEDTVAWYRSRGPR